jgi:hypothetical protein
MKLFFTFFALIYISNGLQEIDNSIFSIKSQYDPYVKFCNGISVSSDTILTTIECLRYLPKSIVLTMKSNRDQNYNTTNLIIYKPLEYFTYENFVLFKVNSTNLLPALIRVTPDLSTSFHLMNVYACNFQSFPKYQDKVVQLLVRTININECNINNGFISSKYSCYWYNNTNNDISFVSGAISSIISIMYQAIEYPIGLGTSQYTKDSSVFHTSVFYTFDEKFINMINDLQNLTFTRIN